MATFVFLHGSFHAAWNWHKLSPLLAARGHRSVAFDLPGHGRDATPRGRVTLKTSVDRVLEIVDRTEGETVLVAHSRSGVVLSEAAEARPDRLTGLVYLAAYLVPSGLSMMDYALLDPASLVAQNIAPAFDPRRVKRLLTLTRNPVVRWLLGRLLPASLATHALAPKAFRDALYHDCPPEIVDLAHALLEPEPTLPGFTPLSLSPERYGRVPKVYVECTQDRAVTLGLQRRMVEDTPCDRVFSLASGHSPFFSDRTSLRRCLLRASTPSGKCGDEALRHSRVAVGGVRARALGRPRARGAACLQTTPRSSLMPATSDGGAFAAIGS